MSDSSENFDPQKDPDMAAYMADLVASGEYAEAFIHCTTCQGGWTALIRRELVERITGQCVFCESPTITATVV